MFDDMGHCENCGPTKQRVRELHGEDLCTDCRIEVVR